RGGRALRDEPEDGRLEEAAQLVEFLALLVGADARDDLVEVGRGIEGEDAEPRLGTGFDDAQRLERLDGLADDGPARMETAGKRVLGGQPASGRDRVPPDQV